ncbi:MAG: hypothetical protein ACOVMQ_00865, partial [Cyclobacteriaceae bacterium]
MTRRANDQRRLIAFNRVGTIAMWAGHGAVSGHVLSMDKLFFDYNRFKIPNDIAIQAFGNWSI